jgi:hypothetical protein
MVARLVERDIELYGVQDDFVHDEHRYVAFVGGRNSGKTYAGSWKAALRAQEGGLGVIAAPDFPMLEFGAKRAFLDRLVDMNVAFSLNGQRGVVTIPRWNAEVRFATLETESRVRGPNYAWCWADEVEYVTDRTIWQALKGAIRNGTNPQLFVTTTPKGRRLVWDEWVQAAGRAPATTRSSTPRTTSPASATPAGSCSRRSTPSSWRSTGWFSRSGTAVGCKRWTARGGARCSGWTSAPATRPRS